MRKFVDKPTSYEVGDTRVRRKFLLFPRRFGRDWRWLEFADIVEEFCDGAWTEPCFWTEKDFADNRTKCIEDIERRLLEQEKIYD